MYPPVGRISLVTGVPLVVSTFESQVETAASSVSKTRPEISRFHRPVLPSSAVAIVRLRPRKMQMFVQGTKDKKKKEKKEGREKNVNTWLDIAVESTFLFFSSPPLFPPFRFDRSDSNSPPSLFFSPSFFCFFSRTALLDSSLFRSVLPHKSA